MCEVLEVSRAGYYKWLKRRVSERSQRALLLLSLIMQIFEEKNEIYGSPRVHEQLKAAGIKVNKKTVAKIMRENGMVARAKRRFKKTTDSNHHLPIAPNLLNREFDAKEPDEVWVSDITYLKTAKGWSYLAVFIDLYSRMVVGWSLSDSMPTELILGAFEMGLAHRGRAPKLVHSDRGSQYASDDFRDLLKKHKCVQSMSRKGDCWDNAVAESFFGVLKSEHIYHYSFETQDQLELSLFEYIAIFYNRRRLHSSLGYITPEQKGQKGKKAA